MATPIACAVVAPTPLVSLGRWDEGEQQYARCVAPQRPTPISARAYDLRIRTASAAGQTRGPANGRTQAARARMAMSMISSAVRAKPNPRRCR